jgi:hypothetical protein
MNKKVKDADASEEKVYASFAEEVWDTLSRIDCTKYTDWIEATAKRPEIGYIAWHTAWSLLKRKFPASTYSHREDIRHPDGTVEVEIDVCISKYSTDGGQTGNEFIMSKQMTSARLSVMDQWMNPIANPTARQVNDSRQRVLVKALAFAGLGLTLWSGDSTPIGVLDDSIDDEQLDLITKLIEKSDTNEASFLKWAGVKSLADITQERYPSARALLEQKIVRKQKEKK